MDSDKLHNGSSAGWSDDTVLPVAVMVGSPGGEEATDPMAWQVTGIVVGQQFASDTRTCAQVRSGPGGDLFLWRGFSVRLRRSQAADYALHLGSDRPEVFVVARFAAQSGLTPLQVTVSLD
ncbi:MAG: DUF3305 domain-containing protein, partial [Ectothiorhodospiraceae bacterium]|nr:DUF3305 domain-containing protein [Ectothiorhodospiraceae bacterium]